LVEAAEKSRGFAPSFPVNVSAPSAVKRKFARQCRKEPTLTNGLVAGWHSFRDLSKVVVFDAVH
jgi:hypothetical protein